MEITKVINGNEATLKISGWLDTQAAPELHAELDKLEDGVEKLEFDLSGLEYISSSGVREVVGAFKKMKGNFSVKGASPEVFSIFKAIGIDKKIKFE